MISFRKAITTATIIIIETTAIPPLATLLLLLGPVFFLIGKNGLFKVVDNLGGILIFYYLHKFTFYIKFGDRKCCFQMI